MLTKSELKTRIFEDGLVMGLSQEEALKYANDYLLTKGEEAFFNYSTEGDLN
jgi:hypothetical protein